MGSESEVKAVRSLMKLNLEGTALRVEESAKTFKVVSNSKGPRELGGARDAIFAFVFFLLCFEREVKLEKCV